MQIENGFSGGVEIGYLAVCPRKVWLYSRGIRLEKESDKVILGEFIHKHSYHDRERKKEIEIDNLIKVDIVDDDSIWEVKYSSRMIEGAKLQIAYYLYYFKKVYGVELVGELRFPKEKRVEKVVLDESLEKDVETALIEIKRIKSLEKPPEATFKRVCYKCAYAELCWG